MSFVSDPTFQWAVVIIISIVSAIGCFAGIFLLPDSEAPEISAINKSNTQVQN